MRKLDFNLEDFKNKIEEGLTKKELSKHYSCSRNTIASYMKDNNLIIPSESYKKVKDIDIINAVASCDTCISDVLRVLGFRGHGASDTMLRKRIRELNIDTSHMSGFSSKRVSLDSLDESQVLFKGSSVTASAIKEYIIRNQIFDYQCKSCGNKGLWNGKNLSLHLDHINGVSNDHSKQNLRLLCPNCHSQTKTYCGRNNTLKNKLVYSENQPHIKNITSKNCPVCNNEMSGDNKFCSKKCSDRAKSKFEIDDVILEIVNSLPMYKAAKKLNISDVGLKKKLISSGYKKVKGIWRM